MKISKLKKSSFLTKDDVEPEIIVTVREVVEEDVAMDGSAPEVKGILYFAELEKGLVLNWTNAQIIAKALGSDDTDDWPGGKIILWHDPSVAFRGELVGGIRARRMPKPARTPEFDDEIPFGDLDVA